MIAVSERWLVRKRVLLTVSVSPSPKSNSLKLSCSAYMGFRESMVKVHEQPGRYAVAPSAFVMRLPLISETVLEPPPHSTGKYEEMLTGRKTK